MTSSPGANLFGGKRFWTFAILASVAFAVSGHISSENEKAEAAAQDARARTLASQSSPVTACENWMRKLYGEGDRNFAIVGHQVVRSSTFDYYMYITFNSTSVLNKKPFTRTEDCNVVWNHSEEAWESRAR